MKRTHSDKRTHSNTKQLDIKALSLISLPMDHAKSILLKQILRPLINYTGPACQYFARPACMFQAVQCNCVRETD
jgi:hypothetical protein